MKVRFDSDADLSLIRKCRVAVIGYGSQGHAHALNLRDSGVTDIIIGLPEGSKSAQRVQDAGFEVTTPAAAVRDADLVAIMAPDETQADLYNNHLHQNLKQGAALLFAHGFAVHFGFIKPRPDLDILMVAPKGPGPQVRSEYVRGSGLLCLLAVHQNATGKAFDLGLSYASAIGCGRAGIIETTFKEECECDLFGEQVVLCGGISHLIRAGYETLVEAGYAPEAAYLECLHETKLVVDLLYERGMAGMHDAISNTAEYGDYVTGPRIITKETKEEMKRVLDDIRSGKFAHDWVQENRAGQPHFKALRRAHAEHPIEKIGQSLRDLIPTLKFRGQNDRRKS